MKVGRFQVMATLQAARAKELGLSITQAKSWGLDRAILYAAAKRGFKEKRAPRHSLEEAQKEPLHKTRNTCFLGDEMAYISKKRRQSYFAIGGELQTVRDFKRQIERRFGKTFAQAWKESLQIVRQYPKEILLSQGGFSRRSADLGETNWHPNGLR